MQENKNNSEKEEKLIDIKGSIESLVEGELPELSQEDAIKAYREGPKKTRRRKKLSSEEDDDAQEDDHLKRLKQELLVSLEKVNKLARQLFGEKAFTNVKDFKVKKEFQKVKGKEQTLEIKTIKEQKSKEREE